VTLGRRSFAAAARALGVVRRGRRRAFCAWLSARSLLSGGGRHRAALAMPPPAAPRWRSPSPARPCRRARDGATLGRRSFRRRLLLSAWCGVVGSALSARGCRRGRVLSGGGRRRAALAAPLPAAPHWRSLSSAKPRRHIRDGVALGCRCSWRRLALSAWCGLVGGTPSLRVAVGAEASSQLKRARDIRTVARIRSPLAPAQPQYANAPRRSGPLSPPPPCARFRLARRPRRPCATHGARNTSRATLRTQHIVRLAPHTHTRPHRTARSTPRTQHVARRLLRAPTVPQRCAPSAHHLRARTPEAPDAPRHSGLPARRRLAFASGSCVDRGAQRATRRTQHIAHLPHTHAHTALAKRHITALAKRRDSPSAPDAPRHGGPLGPPPPRTHFRPSRQPHRTAPNAPRAPHIVRRPLATDRTATLRAVCSSHAHTRSRNAPQAAAQ